MERLPQHEADVKIYGPMHHGMVNAPSHIIPKFHDDWTMDQVFDEYLGKEPDALVIWSSSSLIRFAETDFTKFNCPIFLLLTDALNAPMESPRLNGLRKHKMPPFEAVFHNYLWLYDNMTTHIPAKRYIHYPCWAAHCYDSDKQNKKYETTFFVSGSPSREYKHRKILAAALNGTGLNYVSEVGTAPIYHTNEENGEDNDRFLKLLMESRFSPHDGGVNGRMVPRYFESNFARSTIISPDLGREMEVNGFEHNKNCILFPREYGVEECRKLLQEVNDMENWKDIAEQGHDLILTRHCTDVRIRQMLREVSS